MTPSAPKSARRPPRRLARGARREQLIEAAMPIVADHGAANFSLDELAASADVTRNLLYHYFPRGRADILVAVAERAGHELTDGWVTDESIPLPERMAANFLRFIHHASTPTDAWRIHRQGRAAQDPELQEIIDRFEDVVIEGVSRNNFGTPDPPPSARIAIKGFIAFSETVLDEAREAGLPREQIVALVAQTFPAMLQAALAAVS
ncbi:MAG TPA: TetR/AcrR family transcriptional regulator [Solirubrobacteraceae bacterium]|nr:TetR/AcrR family transcriptional regulator [Solirubrobacteraceae bacterium]